ncbi:MAG: 2-oxoacid:acceptor oxidoreductase subunit alpha [Methanothrix sp.]|nr:2-oxoacid:acceptor oxidoreductase subunit alpha [Methanothrix sp.]
MDEFSTIIGGIAGDGINEAGATIGRLFSRLGYRIFMCYDYPSLIRGGHNYAIVRASSRIIGVHRDHVDLLVALNQDTLERHRWRLSEESLLIYDSDRVKPDGLGERSCGIHATAILKEEGAPQIMRNTCILGALCRATGIAWAVLEEVLKKHIPKHLEQNLEVARRGYDAAVEMLQVEAKDLPPLPTVTGNQAIGLGLIRAGLQAYIAYPMTPSSSLLDFLARQAPHTGLQVLHPENEIAVVLMAQGFAYSGVKAAVGTSGGGFCLMTEGVSLAGMAEMPLVIMMGQRTGPSTGLPTYTAQGDLHFVLNAGQGEFPRFVVSPGDGEEAYFWSGVALKIAWRYQVPAFILADRSVCESQYSFDLGAAGDPGEAAPLLWDGAGEYRRYRYTESGVSPLAFPPMRGQAIKVDGYVHDESGITTEEARITKEMGDKRLLKGRSISRELEEYETVKVLGARRGRTALLFSGSNKWVCVEAAEGLGCRAVQALVLSPFPVKRLRAALEDVETVIAVECNCTAQLARLAGCHGIHVHEHILKYDGRPFSLDDLEAELGRVLT